MKNCMLKRFKNKIIYGYYLPSLVASGIGTQSGTVNKIKCLMIS